MSYSTMSLSALTENSHTITQLGLKAIQPFTIYDLTDRHGLGTYSVRPLTVTCYGPPMPFG